MAGEDIPIVEAPATVVAPGDGTGETVATVRAAEQRARADVSAEVAAAKAYTEADAARRAADIKAAVVAAPLAPTTTAEQNRRTSSQRKVNMVWEINQAMIAGVVVTATIVMVFALLLAVEDELSTAAVTATTILSNAFFVVIGFYFGRTNHARIGDGDLVTRDDGRLDTR